jgi:hypothetical protein
LQNWQTFFFGLRITALAIVVLSFQEPGARAGMVGYGLVGRA